jgi:hypothetical protein
MEQQQEQQQQQQQRSAKERLLGSLSQLLHDETPEVVADAFAAVEKKDEISCAGMLGNTVAMRRVYIMRLVREQAGERMCSAVFSCSSRSASLDNRWWALPLHVGVRHSRCQWTCLPC